LRKAWPADTVRQDQIEQAQQDFKAIKGRGQSGSTSSLADSAT
jgi:hypothetical protein